MSDYRDCVTEYLGEAGAAARLEALARLADAAAHEFNNLRSTIEGTLDLIAADPAAALTERRLTRLRNASARASAVAESMAGLARLRGRCDAALDVGRWALAARPWLSERLGQAIALTLDVPQEPVLSAVHPDSLRVVVRALAANAAAAMGNAGSLTLAIARDGERGMFSLSIADEGAGMSPGVAARAREPFFTTRPPAAGLGLTLAELFVKENGGRLELSSTPGRGTIVSLHLPELGGT